MHINSEHTLYRVSGNWNHDPSQGCNQIFKPPSISMVVMAQLQALKQRSGFNCVICKDMPRQNAQGEQKRDF